MSRGDLDALAEERIHYTIKYASEHSPFYRKWFIDNGIKPSEVRTHEDLRELPIILFLTLQVQRGLNFIVSRADPNVLMTGDKK